MDPSSKKATDLLSSVSDSPSSLPKAVRDIAEAELVGGVVFYGLSDLDAKFRFHRVWVVLGRERLGLIREHAQKGAGALAKTPDPILWIRRSEIEKVRTVSGLTSNSVTLVSRTGGDLATIRHTRRQHTAFEILLSALESESQDSSDECDLDSSDSSYLESIAQPLLARQPGVAASGTQVGIRLLRYLHPYRKQVVTGLAAAAAVAAVGLAPPFLSGRLIDAVMGEGSMGGDQWNPWAIVGLITAAVALRAAFLWLRLRLMSVLGEKVARDLRRDAYGHVQSLGIRYFSKSQTGSLVSRVGADTDRIWEFITFGVAEAILSLFTLVAIGFVLLFLDWRLGLVMVVPLPLIIAAVFRNGRGMHARFTKAWRRWADLNAVVADTIPGIRVVKGFGQESKERERFERENDAVYESFNAVHANWTRFWPVMMLSLHGIGLAVYWFALPRLYGSGAAITPGTFVSFLLFSWMFVQPVEAIAQMGRMVNRSLSSARRVFELLDTAPEPDGENSNFVPVHVRGEIEFSNVWFGYSRVRPVLKDVSFRVAPGETIGIVGKSGVGKSTLVQLIPRFFLPDRGRITVDGTDIDECEIASLRKQMGIVDQDPFLFHGSILDNIRYGKPDARPIEVIEAARVADCHAFVSGLPLGYETWVGERGQTLSGGERQRISLARALLPRPRILLFDEATSSVDGESESRIHHALRAATSGCTVFLIAHRLAALKHADRIFVMDDGRLIQQGTCRELLESCETFRKLFGDQLETMEGGER